MEQLATLSEDEFIKRIESIKPSEMVRLMIDSIKNPRIALEMSTYLTIEEKKCHGCAATNTIMNMYDMHEKDILRHTSISDYGSLSTILHDRIDKGRHMSVIIAYFEHALDDLRLGDFLGFFSGMRDVVYRDEYIREEDLDKVIGHYADGDTESFALPQIDEYDIDLVEPHYDKLIRILEKYNL